MILNIILFGTFALCGLMIVNALQQEIETKAVYHITIASKSLTVKEVISNSFIKLKKR